MEGLTKREKELAELLEQYAKGKQVELYAVIRIGEILIEQKESMQHGEWLPWLDAHYQYSDRTAEKWMYIAEHQDLLEIDNIKFIGDRDKDCKTEWTDPPTPENACSKIRFILANQEWRAQTERLEKLARTRMSSEYKKLKKNRKPHHKPDGWTNDMESAYQQEKRREKQQEKWKKWQNSFKNWSVSYTRQDAWDSIKALIENRKGSAADIELKDLTTELIQKIGGLGDSQKELRIVHDLIKFLREFGTYIESGQKIEDASDLQTVELVG